MEVAQFCSTSHVVIVAGKGGVGKTTVAVNLAIALAKCGSKVGVIEKQQADAARRAKAEPPPIRGDGVNAAAAPTTTLVEELEPSIAVLHARHNFSPEQLKMLNDQYKKDIA